MSIDHISLQALVVKGDWPRGMTAGRKGYWRGVVLESDKDVSPKSFVSVQHFLTFSVSQ